MGRRKLPSIPAHSSYSAPTTYPAPPPGAYSTATAPMNQPEPLKRTIAPPTAPRRATQPQQPPAPVYMTSSAPIPSTSSSYSLFGTSSSTQTAPPADPRQNGYQTGQHQQSQYQQPQYQPAPQQNQQFHDLSRPSSACSNVSYARSIDPNIIPGASFHRPKTALRQPVSVISKKSPHHSATTKLPNTLARVLLKKELKEVLGRRRESLEACEIEANQRQYVVHKMLITGLLPEAREDETPKCIPCLLPIELIAGARVIRPTCTVATQKNEQEEHTRFASQPPRPPPHAINSVGSQADHTRHHTLPPTSLRAQLDLELRRPTTNQYSTNQYSTQQYYPSRIDSGAKTVETQTEGGATVNNNNITTLSYDRYSSSYAPERSMTSDAHRYDRYSRKDRYEASKTNDLMEATRKYFEDYDRQLKDLTEKAKRGHRRQFEFHDDDSTTREMRRSQLIDELARRRERMWATSDLGYDQLPYRAALNQHPLGSSDYASTVPHYGSLPRIDYPLRSRRSPANRDFTYRGDNTLTNFGYNYGSLPRNYERCLGQQSTLEPIQIEYEQSFGGTRPSPYGMTSRSMYDLNADNVIDPRYRTAQNVRSLNYLDQLDCNMQDRDRLLAFSRPSDAYSNAQRQDLYQSATLGRSYANDTNMGRSYANDTNQYGTMGRSYANDTTQLGSAPMQSQDMVSQYATYLNNQFQSGLLTDQPLRINSMPAPMPLLSRYDPPLSDPYHIQQSSIYQQQQQQQLQDPLYMEQGQLSDPGPSIYPSYQAPQVYSRNETNYGSRPLAYNLDYGNMERNRMRNQQIQQQQQHQMQQHQLQQQHQQQQQQYDAYNQSYATSAPIAIPQQTQYNTLASQRGYGTTAPAAYGNTASAGYGSYVPPTQQRGPRSWSNGNLVTSEYDARYPKDDALSRVYATVGRRRPAENNNTRVDFYSLGRHNERQRQIERSRQIQNDDYVLSPTGRDYSPSHIKRILLTRRYKDHNVYNDLGLRVVGGKRMPSGELGAFVSAVNQGKFNQTLGEIKEGDQVLEWNGVLLNGKTFEEVERIVNSSSGEVEIILKAEGEKSKRNSNYAKYATTERSHERNHYDTMATGGDRTIRGRGDMSPDRSPPVPMHRNGHSVQQTRGYDSLVFDESRFGQRPRRDHSDHSLGHLQVSVSYDRSTSRLIVHVLSARGLKMRDSHRHLPPNPFVKIYLLPGRKVSHKRRTRFVPGSTSPEWNQLVEYEVPSTAVLAHFLEFSLWDYDKFSENNALGQVTVSLADRHVLSGVARWYPLQQCDLRASRHHLNAPLEKSMRSTIAPINGYHYNPASLDIGYPAIN